MYYVRKINCFLLSICQKITILLESEFIFLSIKMSNKVFEVKISDMLNMKVTDTLSFEHKPLLSIQGLGEE